QHYVWLYFGQGLHGAFGISPFARQVETGCTADPAGQNLARLRVVFNDRYGNCHVPFIHQLSIERLSLVLMTRSKSSKLQAPSSREAPSHQAPNQQSIGI